MKHAKMLTLCEGALLIAAAMGLSYLEIPVGLAFGGFGGSISFAMLPILVFALRAGWGWGLGAGLIFGTLKFFFAGGVAVNWQSMLFDYSLAYAAVGLAGLLKGRKWGLVTGAALGCAARFLVHFVSGITVYAEYMPEEFLNLSMTSPWFYSLLYNGTYMLPNTVLAIAACAALSLPLRRWLLPRNGK